MQTTSRRVRSGILGSTWIDISVPLYDGMVCWPGDPPVRIERVTDVERGDSHTLSQLTMGSHSGTHIDAPVHFLKGKPGIDAMPLETVIGRARVIEIGDGESVKPVELETHGIRRGERLLFKTQNSRRVWREPRFVKDFVFLSIEAARYLAERKVRLVGIDYLSVGGYQRDGSAVHRILLEAGAWLLEGLDLSPVRPGRYELVCLPLKITGGDGAPARAVVRLLK